MKLYIIQHKPSGKFCYHNTPWNESCFDDPTKLAPRFYGKLKTAKTAMSRGLNNCQGYTDDEVYSEWFQYLLDTEIVEVTIDISSGAVVHRAISIMDEK